ncbi:Protein of unknown function (DUF3325) [Methylophaga frappieri]|uniref:Uncharacterized protein n=2 Tax=Methylophaga frappieri (strain ATCC BAA-2434 / DSM 25690 / JAM7) TaxID=754477 RepID=I1YHW7_METFJ|nr:Protein of unknown function (DUF3325) [Methylophaga frappieri]
MLSSLLALQGLLMLVISQQGKLILEQPLDRYYTLLFQITASLLLSIAILMWLPRDDVSMGISHAIMLFGVIALIPVFMLTYRKAWIPRFASLVPLIGISYQILLIYKN